ncbi:MAG TPA: PIG-L family deacetylase [Anaerolineales bacterium]|nr:PIG-L family deacetylase [Anaerolineales bacterium]
MRWIYISPHLDDAILSAGGLIHDQARDGKRVEIWTLACGFPPEADPSPFAQVLHFQWGFTSAEETVRLRRVEDARAAAIVGAKAVHFDGFFDCIYRRDEKGEPLYPMDVFVEPHPKEADLPAKMTAALAERLQPDDVLVCPLGIGGHADHVIVRRAVERLARPLWYYADVPYVLNHPSELEPSTRLMQAKRQKVSSGGLVSWVEGIAAYTSQISTVFESQEEMREAIESYAREEFCLWKLE